MTRRGMFPPTPCAVPTRAALGSVPRASSTRCRKRVASTLRSSSRRSRRNRGSSTTCGRATGGTASRWGRAARTPRHATRATTVSSTRSTVPRGSSSDTPTPRGRVSTSPGTRRGRRGTSCGTPTTIADRRRSTCRTRRRRTCITTPPTSPTLRRSAPGMARAMDARPTAIGTSTSTSPTGSVRPRVVRERRRLRRGTKRLAPPRVCWDRRRVRWCVVSRRMAAIRTSRVVRSRGRSRRVRGRRTG